MRRGSRRRGLTHRVLSPHASCEPKGPGTILLRRRGPVGLASSKLMGVSRPFLLRAAIASVSATTLLRAPAISSSQAPETARTDAVTFTALSAGNRFSCGLSSSGKAYCWGADAMGQLGIGDPVGRCEESIYAKGACARAPVAVFGDHRFISISAGDTHACAIDDQGAVYCWGENQAGQLGVPDALEQCVHESSRSDENMTLACSRRPTRVPLATPAVSIATGESITCAVDSSGRAWCWGVNRGYATPTAVAVDQPLASIDAGGNYVCGATVSKAVRCWSWPEAITKGVSAPSDRADWDALTVGTRHGCALDAAGSAHCWGSDADGALGIGPNGHAKYFEVPVAPVLGDHRFRSIATGTKRTCAIDDEGALYCWGRVAEAAPDDRCLDSNGVAGTNDCTTRPVPVHQSIRFRSVSIGDSHQCSLSTSGVTLCWGANESGQLGDGTLRSANDPIEVRTGGVTLARTRVLDARERSVWFLAHGGFGLVVVFGLLVGARDWMALRTALQLGLLGIGALALTMLLRAADSFATARGFGDLVKAAAVQPLVIVLGVTVYRAALPLGAWWRAGVPAPGGTGGPAGVGALAAVLLGWLLLAGSMLSIGASRPRGEIGLGLAMSALLQAGGIALVLSAIAAVVSVVTLRRYRSAKAARVALVLASLTLVGGAVVASMLFWPTER